MLIHWPGVAKFSPSDAANQKLRLQTWQALEAAHKAGKTRAIGVSNFSSGHLEHLIRHAATVPAVNQVELHPRYQQVRRLVGA
jgi:diketogulonate reductase-like aldo/keto reductase